MKRILCLFLGIVPSSSIYAQEEISPDTSALVELASSIYRVKTGPRGNLRWSECGTRLTQTQAMERSVEYARYFLEEKTADPDFDPWVGASIAMQESSFNRCAISRGAWRKFVSSFRAANPNRDPREREIVRLLSSSRYRSLMGVEGRFDAGLVQFRYPGVEARRAGLTSPGNLVNARISIQLLANSMARYREACSSVDFYDGVHTVNRRDGRVSVLHYHISCEDGYWVQHNSPARFNYRYYWNVSRWLSRFREASSRPNRVIADTVSPS